MSRVTGLDSVNRKLDLYVVGAHKAAMEAAAEIEELLVTYARAHHIWKPITHKTDETTLAPVTEVAGEIIRITLSAGMPYDVFLETAHDGKWAWLWPAIIACEDPIRAILIAKLGKGSLKP